MNYSKPRGGYYSNIQLWIIVNLEGDIIMNKVPQLNLYLFG